ncbi:MAG: hypothetical protein J6K74_01360 [Marinifilaceae bacterium]|nr:hypothetical protein [Marinifilaceae bacterium]
MAIAHSFINQRSESIEIEKSKALCNFKQYLYAEDFKSAFEAAKKELNFDKIYLLVVKNDQKLSTFPDRNREIDGKVQPYIPEFYSQLAENGFIHITSNDIETQELYDIMKRDDIQEFYLYPIYSSFEALTFICCARRGANTNLTVHLYETSTINYMSILIGETIDRINYRSMRQQSFA